VRDGDHFLARLDPNRKQREDEGIGSAADPDRAGNLQTGSELRLKRLNLRSEDEGTRVKNARDRSDYVVAHNGQVGMRISNQNSPRASLRHL
jgi:hypothetical protein